MYAICHTSFMPRNNRTQIDSRSSAEQSAFSAMENPWQAWMGVSFIEDVMNTEWRDVVGYEGIYKISNRGELRKILINGILGKESGTVGTQGYKVTKLYAYGKKTMRSIHSMVAEAFIGPYPKDKEINHIDGNKQNNSVENLEYITKTENMNHAIKMGLRWVPKGSACKQSILTESDVAEIRRIAKERGFRCGQKQLANQFGVSERTIQSIIYREHWKHVA